MRRAARNRIAPIRDAYASPWASRNASRSSGRPVMCVADARETDPPASRDRGRQGQTFDAVRGHMLFLPNEIPSLRDHHRGVEIAPRLRGKLD